jgi:hypothetical protein
VRLWVELLGVNRFRCAQSPHDAGFLLPILCECAAFMRVLSHFSLEKRMDIA